MTTKIEKDRDLPSVVYTPDSQMKKPGMLFRAMVSDLLASRELAWRLFVRNVSSSYRQTYLGYLWAFVPPLFTAWAFVYLSRQKILSVGDTGIPYAAYVMIGTLLWQVFVDALTSPIKLVTQSREMLLKINFPREALVLAGIADVLFNFIIRLILMAAVVIFFNVHLGNFFILFPAGVLSILMLGLVIGIILTPAGVLYHDIEKGLLVVTSLWFFITPVAYPMPKTWPSDMLAKLNPVTPVLVTTREFLTSDHLTQGTGFIAVTCASLLLLIVGWVLYRVAMPHVIARIGS